MRRQLAYTLFLAASTAACVDSKSANDPTTVSSDLEQPTGGFDTADEAPAFAQEAEFDAAAIEADTVVADSTASDPSVASLANAPDVDAHDMLLVWGKLPADPNETAFHDWSGSLSLSRGALVVNRTIAFEDATDRMMPRTDARTINFASRTRPFVDGLALKVLVPAAPAGAIVSPPTLTYTPADGSPGATLDLSQLAAGPIVIDTADGDRIVAIGERRNACHHGFMRGRWHALTPNIGGYLGRVVNADGEPVGHVRGIYGTRRDGSPAMFGKFIDRDGHFVGIIKGTYENGEYKARWIDRAGDHGGLHGRYFEATGAERGGFIGRWAEASCSEDPPAPTPAP